MSKQLTNSPPGTAYADTILFAIPNTNLPGLIPLTITSWALDLIVNVSVTLTIAGRLWWMGRNVASFRADHSTGNPYSYSIYVIVESGAIFAGATIVMLALYLSENGSPFPYSIPSLDVASQLAVRQAHSLFISFHTELNRSIRS
jgi:hypothetical protein